MSSVSLCKCPKGLALLLLVAATILAEASLASAALQRGQRLKALKLAEQQQQPMAEGDFGASLGSRMFYPGKLVGNSQFGGGPRMAAWNDWADPAAAEQILSLKRASLLARLATQSARGFGRK